MATGECQEIKEHPVREPLFIRNLRGGRWKVLRWLTGTSGPQFAAEGPLLAIGARRLDRRMTVSILDLATGATQPSFQTPLGQLAFASPQRLVLEIPDRVAVARRPRAVSLRLYSTRGNYLADLGSMTEPLISGMHIVAYENGTLSVRSVGGGAQRPIVGFNSPARALRVVRLPLARSRRIRDDEHAATSKRSALLQRQLRSIRRAIPGNVRHRSSRTVRRSAGDRPRGTRGTAHELRTYTSVTRRAR